MKISTYILKSCLLYTSLKRYIQRTVETLAARIILEGDIDTGSVIEIDVKDGKLDAKVVK